METFYDIGTNDLKDIWDYDLDTSDPMKLSSDTDMQDWFLERDAKFTQVILHDKLISDALLGTVPIKTEHSYSLNSEGDSTPDSPGSLSTKMDDMEEECYPAISLSTATNNLKRISDSIPQLNNRNNKITAHLNKTDVTKTINTNYITKNSDRISFSDSEIDIDDTCIKDEPMSPESSCPSSPNSQTYEVNINMANVAAYTNSDLVFEHKNGSLHLSPKSKSILKNHNIILEGVQKGLLVPKFALFDLPPTPPLSLASDESEDNQTPEHQVLSPISPQGHITSSNTTITTKRPNASVASSSVTINSTQQNGRSYSGSTSRHPIHTPLISSQPKGSTGTLILTDEEKRTLLAEGYAVPTRLPLTKAEEKSLKKIRRKIKNKISAQESRRKKKEYMDQLERKVEILVTENSDYRKRVEKLEDSNANLLNQLTKLQAILSKQQYTKKA